MKRNFIAFICLISFLTPYSHAYNNSSSLTINISDGEGEKLPLQIKTDPEHNGKPPKRFLIPEVTLQGNTLQFITPCNGCTFRLVQDYNISYEIEIIGGILNIPTAFTGIYELQIVNGDIIFYTEVVL